MFNALYCGMIYRHKKLKKFEEGFIESKNGKLILYNDQKQRIDSIFSKRELEDGLELDFERHYCLVQEIVGKVVEKSIIKPRIPFVGLKRKPLHVRPSVVDVVQESTEQNIAHIIPQQIPKIPQQMHKQVTLTVTHSRLSMQDIPNGKNDQLNQHNEEPQEMSQDQLLALFTGNLQQEKKIPPIVTHPDRKRVSRFAQFVDESSSDDDDIGSSNAAGLPEVSNTTTTTRSFKPVEAIPSQLPEPKAAETPKAHTSITLKPPARVKHQFKAVPLHPLPNEFRTANSFQNAPQSTPKQTHKEFKKPFQKVKKAKSQQFQNQYGFVFDPSQYSKRFYRKQTIPTFFKTIDAYKLLWKNAIVEVVNLGIADVATKYGKFKRADSNLESYMRSKRVSFYEGVKLRSMERDSGVQFGCDVDRCNHVSLEIYNKEHHSVYSKDDLWAVSSSIEFDQVHFFTSYYYGPSSGSIELTPLSKHHEYKQWYGGAVKLFAIRILNIASEMMILGMLEHKIEMAPITPYLLGIPKQIEKGLVKDTQSFHRVVCDAIEEFGLNLGQRQAVDSFCKSLLGNSKPIVLVHGVYGSGKSFLLSVLIITLHRAYEAGLLEENTKVAFASMTNVAVDRILLSLLEMGYNDFVRVGSIRKIAKPILPFTCHKSEANAVKELETIMQTETLTAEEEEYVRKSIKNNENQTMLMDAFLIGITTLATNFGIVQDIECPIMILDECSQMTEPMSLLPMTVFKSQFVMCVGDPKQLPPTLSHSMESKSNNGIETTLFERLAKTCVPVMLNTQYRCHPNICTISNELFYDGKLVAGIDASKRSNLIQGLNPVSFISLDGQESKIGGSFSNSMEAKVIITLVKHMVEHGVEASQIGIISLYKGQANFIQDHLKQAQIPILCATVDSFQGAEMDVIIVSTVRTMRSEFLEDPRRINVALTRAKRHLVMVASDSMVHQSKLWKDIKRICADCVTDPATLFHSLSM